MKKLTDKYLSSSTNGVVCEKNDFLNITGKTLIKL